ncbi:Glyoxylate reductase [Bacillus cereus]|nr:Glyoxylate reductase [Bacillus cereus]
MMKKTAYIVNASRGPIMNEAALAHALKRMKLKEQLLTCLNLNRNYRRAKRIKECSTCSTRRECNI